MMGGNMTEKDPEIDIIDDTITSIVYAHQWEITDGLDFNPASDLLLRCSCSKFVTVFTRDQFLEAFLENPLFGLKCVRQAHQKHVIDELGKRLRELFNVSQGTAALK
jgi:hypothetical protein